MTSFEQPAHVKTTLRNHQKKLVFVNTGAVERTPVSRKHDVHRNHYGESVSIVMI